MKTPISHEKVLSISSILAALIVTPFVYFRYIEGDILISLINGATVVVLLCFYYYVLKTKNIELAKAGFTVFLTFSIVIVIMLRGLPHIYWMYPALIAFHYILPPKMAGFISLLAITSIAMTFYPTTELVDFLAITLSLLLTALLAFFMFNGYREKNEQLTRLSRVDPLTLTGNRRALDKKLAMMLADQRRSFTNISLLLLDLDHFKKINDYFGHAVGDEILIEVVNEISKNLRSLDSIFRYGGEEFVIVPLMLDLPEAQIVAEKIRNLIAEHTFNNEIKLTISIGVAKYRSNESAQSWLARADAALYRAKHNGRNRVELEQP